MTIRAVLFDLDDTLIDDTGSFRQAVAATAEEIAREHEGLSAAPLAEAYIKESNEVWTSFDVEQSAGRPEASDTGEALRHESWRRALRACGVEEEDLVPRAVVVYARWREQTVEFLPGAEEMLARLRGLVKTAVVTNGAADVQRWKLRQFGLEESADYCIVSEEFGRNKPDPSIFLHVAEELGVPAEHCLMVGDSLKADIAGAKAAGMQSAWMNRTGEASRLHAPEPDWVVTSPKEVRRIVEENLAQRG
ncbi:MAG: HAD family hydrolase [Proteobacteria bacterium]|nr:HAD family hydrolase [Pseudomonadota bacterium]